MICIYAIINIIDDKHYVGQTSDKDYRWIEHRKQLRGFYHHNIYLQRAWCKHGEDNFVFMVLEVLNNTLSLNVREKYWAYILNSEYNIAPPGEGMRGYSHTDEARKKMSRSQLGSKKSDVTKAKHAENMKGNKRAAGIKQDIDRVEARAALHRGHPKSDEHKAKLSASQKGRTFTDEHRAKLSAARRNMLTKSLNLLGENQTPLVGK